MNFNDFKNSENLLSNEQMKSVKGGTGTCGYITYIQDESGGWTSFAACGVSQSEALQSYSQGAGGGNWCCDSCSTTSYCGNNAR